MFAVFNHSINQSINHFVRSIKTVK